MNKSRNFLKIHYVLMQEPIVQIWQFTKKSNPLNVVTLGFFFFLKEKKEAFCTPVSTGILFWVARNPKP